MTCNIEAAAELFPSGSATLANLSYSGADQGFVIAQITNIYSDAISSEDIVALGETLINNGYPSAGLVITDLYNDFFNACTLATYE